MYRRRQNHCFIYQNRALRHVYQEQLKRCRREPLVTEYFAPPLKWFGASTAALLWCCTHILVQNIYMFYWGVRFVRANSIGWSQKPNSICIRDICKNATVREINIRHSYDTWYLSHWKTNERQTKIVSVFKKLKPNWTFILRTSFLKFGTILTLFPDFKKL